MTLFRTLDASIDAAFISMAIAMKINSKILGYSFDDAFHTSVHGISTQTDFFSRLRIARQLTEVECLIGNASAAIISHNNCVTMN